MTKELLGRLMGYYTKSSEERVMAMAAALIKIEREDLSGDVVECGVWRGGNMILARLLAPQRVCWLYDTFTGMTAPTELDFKAKGPKKDSVRALDLWEKKKDKPWMGVSVEEVREHFHIWNLKEDDLRFVKGPVEETLLIESNLPEKIALLRLDTDWHASTKIELEVLYPRLVPGGVLIVDDYGHWAGARQAVQDYFGDKIANLVPIDYTAVQMVKT